MARNGKTHELVTRTNRGLRAALFDEIDAVRQGNSNPSRANSIARLATVIVDGTRLELEVAKYMRTVPNDEQQDALTAKLETTLGPTADMKLA